MVDYRFAWNQPYTLLRGLGCFKGGKTLEDTFTNEVKKHEDEKLDIEHEQGSGVG